MIKQKKHLENESIKAIIKAVEIDETILEIAIDLKADIIVMGSHSRNWLENIVLGS